MKLYHVTNGKPFRAPAHIQDEAAYRDYLKAAYGSLKGVKIVWATSRADATLKSIP